MKTILESAPPIFLLAIAGVAYTSFASAQIVTDGSVGATVTLNGVDVQITESLGTRAGNNLFHSFETFNIQADGSATFTGASDINNVISRVTGGDVSTIQGTLRSEVGGADFYFINPAGVTFSEGSSVDVPASFHLSTADELQFSDGSVFSAQINATSSLSIADPASFGFLESASGSIEITGSAIEIAGAQSELSIVSSQSTFIDSTISASDVTIVSTGSVATQVTPTDSPALFTGSEVMILEETVISSNGEGAQVRISGDQIQISNGARVVIETVDAETVNAIEIVAGDLVIDGQGSLQTGIITDVLPDAAGMAADINVNVSGDLVLDNDPGDQDTSLFSGISSQAQSGSIGDTGSVSVVVGGLATIGNAAEITSQINSQGNAGSVSVAAGELFINNLGSGIASLANPDSTGNAGTVNVLSDLTTIQDAGLIGSLTFSEGNAGSVSLVSGELVIDGQGSDFVTGITSDTASTGNAGSVVVAVEELATVRNGGEISSSTFSEGEAGVVELSAGQLLIDGQGTDFFTGIASNTIVSGSTGNSGGVQVTIAELATIQNGGGIASNTFSEGNAGSIRFAAGALFIDGQGSDNSTGITSLAGIDSTGNAGTVDVAVVEQTTIQNGGQITSSTFSSGEAGSVELSAGQLLIDREDSDFFTGIASDAMSGSTGNAGSVAVTIAELATIQDGGGISANTFSEGDAGNVELSAGQLLIDGQGSVFPTNIGSGAGPGSTGSAGEVSVTVAGLAAVQNAGTISSGTFSVGDAGSVELSAGQLLIDGQGSDNVTGIISQASSGSTGNAGTVAVTVIEQATIQNGGELSSNTFSEGDAGTIELSAGQLLIDRQGSDMFTGVGSAATSISTGNAGGIELTITEQVTIQNGGSITSSTFSEGDAGTIELSAGQLLIDRQDSDSFTGIVSNADVVATGGNAGSVSVTVAALAAIQNGGGISSDTFSEGDGGSVELSAGQLLIDGQDSDGVTGIGSQASSESTGNAGNVEVTIAEQATIRNGGVISSSTQSEGEAGRVELSAGQLLIDRQGSDLTTGIASIADIGSTGNAGGIVVTIAEQATIQNGGVIASDTFSVGEAGSVELSAEQLLIDRQNTNFITGIVSNAAVGSTGSAGDIEVTISELATIIDGGEISSGTLSEGEAGSVRLSAGRLLVDGQGSDLDTDIASNAESGSTGIAGDVEVTIAELATIQNGGVIASATFANGNAGSVSVAAAELLVDGQGGDNFTGVTSQAGPGSTGDAGTVELSIAEQVTIQSGGLITSNTFSGEAGSVAVSARRLLIDGQINEFFVTGIASSAEVGSTGNAGDVELSIAEQVTIQNGGMITSGTFSVGNAGRVSVAASELLIDRQGSEEFTGITSSANPDSTGNAGTVEVAIAEQATIQNGGQIISSTFSQGQAGNVELSARQLLIDKQDSNLFTGIASTAEPGSTGDAGGIDVSIAELATVQSGGEITSSAFSSSQGNAGSVVLQSETGTINLTSNALITSTAAGENSSSGSIDITNGGALIIDGASISTISDLGPAGPISISTQLLQSDSAEITTTSGSVSANGGDISIDSEVFVLNETFIQANAESGSGGVIDVTSSAIVPFGNQLNLDSQARLDSQLDGGNVIQAVAPDGVTVPPQIETPEIDISGSLTELDSGVVESPKVAADPCSAVAAGNSSSLVSYSKGALPVRSVQAPLSVAPGPRAEVQIEEISVVGYQLNATGVNSGCRPSNG